MPPGPCALARIATPLPWAIAVTLRNVRLLMAIVPVAIAFPFSDAATTMLFRIKNPSGYFLELYNAEHTSPPGAVRGQLKGVS